MDEHANRLGRCSPMIGTILRTLLASRVGSGALILAIALAWHVFDKRQAVATARAACAAEQTHARLQATQKQLRIERYATAQLNEKHQVFEGEIAAYEHQIAAYENETPAPENCAADADLLNRLQSN